MCWIDLDRDRLLVHGIDGCTQCTLAVTRVVVINVLLVVWETSLVKNN